MSTWLAVTTIDAICASVTFCACAIDDSSANEPAATRAHIVGFIRNSPVMDERSRVWARPCGSDRLESRRRANVAAAVESASSRGARRPFRDAACRRSEKCRVSSRGGATSRRRRGRRSGSPQHQLRRCAETDRGDPFHNIAGAHGDLGRLECRAVHRDSDRRRAPPASSSWCARSAAFRAGTCRTNDTSFHISAGSSVDRNAGIPVQRTPFWMIA